MINRCVNILKYCGIWSYARTAQTLKTETASSSTVSVFIY